MATEVKTQRTSTGIAWLVGMAVLVVAGAVAWGFQLSKGMAVLGINQIITWGVYIAGFFTLAGLASGLLFLAVLSDLDVLPSLKASRFNLLMGALGSYIAAGFMILMDIGKPTRVLNMVFSAQIKSPFVWDFFSLTLGVILTIILLALKGNGKWLSVISGIVAGLIVIFEGWILSMSVGRHLWHGGMMPGIFLVEGLLLALGVVMIFLSDRTANDALRSWVLFLLPVLFLLNLFQIGGAVYNGELDEVLGTNLMLSNPFFWLAVVLGIILPFLLLIWIGKNRAVVVVSAILVVLGVFVMKSVTLVAGQAPSFLMGTATYTPTIVEAGGVIGLVGLAGLLFLLGKRFDTAKTA
jgi:molybdopterin-containing oxidoreductase family membrane subunit